LAISPVKNTVHHNRTGFFCDFCTYYLAKMTGCQRRRKSLDMQEELTASNDGEDISSIFEAAIANIERISSWDDSHYRVLSVS
jgi:hypothetical protein